MAQKYQKIDKRKNKKKEDQRRENNLAAHSQELGIGEVFTYTELCRLFDEPLKKGGGKDSQLKFWSRYFNFEKIDRKFIITEVYDKPREKETYLPANTLYVEYIEYILLFFLYHQEERITYITRQQLYLVLGLINEDYVINSKNKDALIKDIEAYINIEETDEETGFKDTKLDVDKKAAIFYINDFYNRCSRKFTSIVDASLKSLQRRRFIEFSTSYHLYFISYDEGRPYYFDRYATDVEIGRIVNIERYALDQLGRYTEADVYLHNEDKKYYEIVLKEAQKVYPGLKRMYKCIKFIYNENHIREELTSEIAERKKLELNEISFNVINEQIQKTYDKSLDEEIHYSKRYLTVQYYLCNKLIKII